MRLPRRRFLRLAAMAAAAPAVARGARAQTFPARPLRLVVGFPAGGPNDILGRLIAQWLAPRLGQPVEVENQPGSSGNIATAAVVRAPADGHTLLLVGPANAISESLPEKLDFVFLRDIAPVAGITREPLALVVHPAVPAKDVAELIALARADPGKVRMASTGAWSAPHVSGELFKMLTGIRVETVHYAGGGPALKELAAGNAQMMFEPMSAAIGPVRAGKLRALAVTTATRVASLDVPTVGDTVPGYEASAVTGIGVPRDTPTAIVDKLNAEITTTFADPAMRTRFADSGGNVLPGTPAEFARLMADETEKWAKVVRFASAGK
ncbi:MAG TPA: tripartite tricarboxylate transporter substrate-binding protein [Xanthobacteraceae bacterium]|nr:tripartite tricarboxylate transporter substrate-binding protein [Xanthobacteraceae bacterium]